MNSADVLQAFRSDSPYLFAGAAFIAIGLVAAGLAAFRRSHNLLLVYFALFASLYGLRLWLQADIVKMTLHNGAFFLRIASAIDYMMAIPALLFLDSAGLLRKFARTVLYCYAAAGILLALTAIALGPAARLSTINRWISILALVFLIPDLLRKQASSNSDLVAIRRGLLVFVVFALFNNLGGAASLDWPNLEPIGFAVFLAALGYVAARQTRQRDHQLKEIQKELEIARRIQLSILPAEFPEGPHFKVAARYVPMTSVAGDFYDYVLTGPDRAAILIADVSGHGVPAALIASMVKLAAGSQRPNADRPSQFLSGMNAALCGNTQGQFVTAAYVHLDSQTASIRYAAAGHPPMLRLRGTSVEEVEENGLILAAFDFATYSEISHQLNAGDRLLLYTDGIIEAANKTGEFFGRERLAMLLTETACSPASEAATKIVEKVQEWSVEQEDDLTVIVCDFAS